MERTVWTDERIDDMVATSSEQFERLWTEVHDMRREMNAGFEGIRRDMLHLTIAMVGAFAALFAALVALAL